MDWAPNGGSMCWLQSLSRDVCVHSQVEESKPETAAQDKSQRRVHGDARIVKHILSVCKLNLKHIVTPELSSGEEAFDPGFSDEDEGLGRKEGWLDQGVPLDDDEGPEVEMDLEKRRNGAGFSNQTERKQGHLWIRSKSQDKRASM